VHQRRLSAQLKEGLLHYGSRRRHGYRAPGEACVEQLVDRAWSGTSRTCTASPWTDWRNSSVLAEKSATNLHAAIQASRSRGLARLLFALGIRVCRGKRRPDPGG